jgi:hypothetical protein
MRATIIGEAVSEVISHTAATSCIQVPMFEVSDAIQSARKRGLRSGSQADALLNGFWSDIAFCISFTDG